jgi:hypothetical protein
MYQECRHITTRGAKCQSPALRDMPYCYFHARLHRLSSSQTRSQSQTGSQEEPLELPPLEDRCAIQIALNQTLSALASSQLDPKRAGLLLYGLQIASRNVTEGSVVLSQEAVRALSVGQDGQELAPERSACEPPEDCYECTQKDTCDDYEIYFDDEEEEDE